MMPFNRSTIAAILTGTFSLAPVAVAAPADWQDQAVIHLESTPHARLKPNAT